MSNFGGGSEATDGYIKRLWTGVENFKVTSLNPTQEQLKAIYGDGVKEPVYVGKGSKGDEPNKIEFDQVRLDFYIESENDIVEDIIKTKISFYLGKYLRSNTEGTKKQLINAFGQTAWLTDAQVEEGKTKPVIGLVGGKGTYEFNTKGMRQAYEGEDQFIEFLRNLLNLPSPKTAEKESDAMSQFSTADLDAIIRGDVKSIAGLISRTKNKVGLLLGVKTVGDKMYQDVYNRKTLRQYAKNSAKFDWLRKDVESAQQNGAYPNTNFGDSAYKLVEFLDGAIPTNSGAIAKPPAANFGSFEQVDF